MKKRGKKKCYSIIFDKKENEVVRKREKPNDKSS